MPAPCLAGGGRGNVHARKSVLILSLLTCTLATTGWADDPRTEKFYSDGVQAFYRGNYSRSIQAFDLATGYGSVDPRVYYFRGIAKSRQGAATRPASILSTELSWRPVRDEWILASRCSEFRVTTE